MRRLAPLVLVGALLAGCGEGGNKPVAHVGGQAITQRELAAVVDHFREESAGEGRQFPDRDTERFRRVRNPLLGLLVYRAELKQAARRFGVGDAP